MGPCMSSQREGGGDGSSDGVTTNPVSSPRGGGKGHGYGGEVDGGGEDFRMRRSSLGGTNTLMNSLNLSGWPPGPESIMHTDGFENNDVVLEVSTWGSEVKCILHACAAPAWTLPRAPPPSPSPAHPHPPPPAHIPPRT